MLTLENKSEHNSSTTFETSREIKNLRGLFNTVDIFHLNKFKNGNANEIPKQDKPNHAIYGISPRNLKLNNNISRLVRKYNKMYTEDLTEVTITDLITEPSESSRSPVTVDMPPLEYFRVKNNDINDSSRDDPMWLLLTPDASYKNALNFNEQKTQKKQHYDFNNKEVVNKQHSTRFNFPILRINSLQQNVMEKSPINDTIFSHLHNILTSSDQIIGDNCDLLVAPKEVIRNLRNLNTGIRHLEHHRLNYIPEIVNDNQSLRRKKFILQNLLKVDFTEKNVESYNENPSNNFSCLTESLSPKSSFHKEMKQFSDHKNYDSSDHSDNVTLVENDIMDDPSMSDTVLYHGYVITPDFVSKIQPKEFSKRLPLKEMRDIGIKEISVTDSKPNNQKKYSNPVFIEQVPILPPDMLGNIKLTNGNNTKKFLSVKSVDEFSWNGFKDIILNDNFVKHPGDEDVSEMGEFRNSEILDTDVNCKDHLTVNILESEYMAHTENNVKDNLMKSLREMDQKIVEMENISSVMERNFTNSKKLLLSVNRSDQKLKASWRNDLNDKKGQLVFVESSHSSDNDILNQSEADISKISSNEMMEAKNGGTDVTETYLSEPFNLDEFPKLNFSFIENDGNEDNIVSEEVNGMTQETTSFSHINRNKSVRSPCMKRTYLIRSNDIRNMNRNERDKRMCMQRKKDARKLAVEALTGLGLPTQNSADIPIKIINNPTSNEMMLNQLYKNEHHAIPTRKTLGQDENILVTYKPIRRVSFTNKVRLQRPEITRRKKEKKTVTYTDQLIALQPQYDERLKQKGTYKCKPKNQSERNLTPRSIISQDTDVNSMLTDWSIPDNVKRILNENSLRDGLRYTDDLSQIPSLNSNSLIDWDQISEMLHQHEH